MSGRREKWQDLSSRYNAAPASASDESVKSPSCTSPLAHSAVQPIITIRGHGVSLCATVACLTTDAELSVYYSFRVLVQLYIHWYV